MESKATYFYNKDWRQTYCILHNEILPYNTMTSLNQLNERFTRINAAYILGQIVNSISELTDLPVYGYNN